MPNDLRAVATLLYAGISLTEIQGLRPEHIRDTPPVLPGVRYERRGLTHEQASGLLSYVDQGGDLRDRAIMWTAVLCGLRQIELRRLRVGDVTRDGAHRYLFIRGKGGSKRWAYLPAPASTLVDALLETLEDNRSNAPLFQTHRNGLTTSLTESGMRYVILKYMGEITPDHSPHALRHSLLTWLLNSGADLTDAMDLAGHTEAASHELYAAASDSWFIQAWRRHHPIALWGEEHPMLMGLSHIYIPGKPYGRRMASGVERVVPIPTSVLQGVRRPLEALMSEEFIGVVWYERFRNHSLGPRLLREAAQVHMAERGGHPFLVSLVTGITVQHAVASRFHRRGSVAWDARLQAVLAATDPVRRVFTQAQEAVA